MYLHLTFILETSADNVFQKSKRDQNDDEPNHDINERTQLFVSGIRGLSAICLFGVAIFFGLRPSRTIRQIIVHKVCRTSLNIEVKFFNLILFYTINLIVF